MVPSITRGRCDANLLAGFTDWLLRWEKGGRGLLQPLESQGFGARPRDIARMAAKRRQQKMDGGFIGRRLKSAGSSRARRAVSI